MTDAGQDTVKPTDRQAPDVEQRADAGTDASIAARLERDPENREARLDRALDESMDASDPPAATQPVHQHHVPESSGYDPKHEARLAAGQGKGFIGRVLAKLGLA